MAPTRLVVLFVFALILLLGPQEGASGHKIAFLYATSISDFGYSYSHELARIAVEKSLTSQGMTTLHYQNQSLIITRHFALFSRPILTKIFPRSCNIAIYVTRHVYFFIRL
jgi:hypothetical protein